MDLLRVTNPYHKVKRQYIYNKIKDIKDNNDRSLTTIFTKKCN